MKTMRLLLFPIIFLMVINALWSCSGNDYDPRLLRAERVIFERPDSSISILDSISISDFDRQSDRALYAMLVTEALEKLHLRPTDDSLIAIATDYYDHHKDVERQVISHYYRGITQFNCERYSPAIVSLFQARELAGKAGLDFWRGMAARGIADIYSETFNSAEDLNYAREQYEYTKKSGRQPYVNYAINDLAGALGDRYKYDESNELLFQLLDSAKAYDDPYLRYIVMQQLTNNHIMVDKYDDAYTFISDACSSPFSCLEDTFLLCYTLINLDKLAEAEVITDRYPDEDKHGKMELKHQLASRKKEYKEAYIACDSALKLTNSYIRKTASHTLSSSLSDYFAIRESRTEAELKASKLSNLLLILVTLFVVITIAAIAVTKYRHQRRKIDEKVFLAEQLREELENIREENCASMSVIKNLLSSKYQLLDELGSIIMQSSDTSAARKRIADAVTKIINDLTIGSGIISKLEEEVNSVHNNLLIDFRKDLPDLKEADYRLFLFSVLGLSNAVISLFLKEEKIEAVYNRRRRLKDKIKKLDEENNQKYMKFL